MPESSVLCWPPACTSSFFLESLRWTDEKTRATFKMTLEQAHSTREIAFNQGFYNLFLALEVLTGLLLLAVNYQTAGYALMLFGMASMAAAALLLFVTSPDKRALRI